MQRDLRGQREAASGDLSERAARKDTGHGITFFRICTFAYCVREISTAFFRTPCGSFICWGVAPKPHWGFHPQSPERAVPAAKRTRYDMKRNLHVHLPCPREMGNAHFSNVKPVPIKYSDNLYDTFR